MAQIHFNVPDIDYMKFKSIVGDRGMNKILRLFVQSYTGGESNMVESELALQLKHAEEDKLELLNKITLIRSKLDTIQEQRKIEQQKQNILEEAAKKDEMETEYRTAKIHLADLVWGAKK